MTTTTGPTDDQRREDEERKRQRKADMELLRQLVDEYLSQGYTLEQVRLDPIIRPVLLRLRTRAQSMAEGERRFLHHRVVSEIRNPDGTRKWKSVRMSLDQAVQLGLPFTDTRFQRTQQAPDTASDEERTPVVHVYAQPAGDGATTLNLVPFTPAMRRQAYIETKRAHIFELMNAAWLTPQQRDEQITAEVWLTAHTLQRLA